MDNFEIMEKLGKGSFSKVYKVRRKIDNKIYALKKMQILDASEKQKINSLNEIRVLASINSKYIINYKEAFFDTKDSSLCLVMEYADKGDLSKIIKEHKKSGNYFDEKDIWKIFIQLVKGLKSLHDLNIIHRDIKSSNIFLFSNGEAKLGDLNVCKILSNNILGKTQTGTPSFASPEVWIEKPYGLKSDIWSLGCVLYEIVTLKCPFIANNSVELYNKIFIGAFKKIPKIFSNDLTYIIEHMIKFEPEKRISCNKILDFISKKIGNELNNNENLENTIDNIINNDDQKLLDTIYIPKDLLYLNNQLPKSNYNQEIKLKYQKTINLKPIKIKHDYNSIKQNYNKFNSDGKLLLLSDNNRYSQNSKTSKNLNLIFNQDLLNNKKNELDVNKSSKNVKGPIKLMRINKNLLLKNDLKKKEFSIENNIHNDMNINDLFLQKKSNSLINSKSQEKKLDQKERSNLSQLNKEMKNYYFPDQEKNKQIFFYKKGRKIHVLDNIRASLKYKTNRVSIEKNNLLKRYSECDIYNNYSDNNKHKRVNTDINIISENKYSINCTKLILDTEERQRTLTKKYIKKYELQNNKDNVDILPVLK